MNATDKSNIDEILQDTFRWLESRLSLSVVSAEDNFLDLGGNSAIMVEFRKYLLEKHNLAVSAYDLFSESLEVTIKRSFVK